MEQSMASATPSREGSPPPCAAPPAPPFAILMLLVDVMVFDMVTDAVMLGTNINEAYI